MLSRLAVAALLLFACTSSADVQAVSELSQSLAARARAIDELDESARGLTERAARISEQYATAERDFVTAHVALRRAIEARWDERSTFASAARTYEVARERWQWAQYAIIAAAVADAARLEARRGRFGSGSCEDSMSTGAFRRMMSARGYSIFGTDTDHIVPLSRGGADHPENYTLMPARLNRSLGASWGPEKCRLVGRDACARAVAISRKCGAYTGGMPTW